MTELRPVKPEDAVLLQKEIYPDLSILDILDMMAAWDTHTYDGKRFDMLSIVEDGRLAGTISLFKRSPNCASIGLEVFAQERRKGIATAAMRQMLQMAAEKGYRIIQQQIRADNTASIRLHEKLGFETDGYIYQNRKHHEVLIYLKAL